MATRILLSSVEEVEAAGRDFDRSERLMFVLGGCPDLSEAAVMYSLLQIYLRSSCWEVQEEWLRVLRLATEHYENLGLLEILLDLVELDLKDGVAMRAVRFQGVRSTANDVVTSAPSTSQLSVLNSITIEAQRLARVTKALGFGAADLELPGLNEDDLDWLSAEDAGSVCFREGYTLDHQLHF